VGFVPAAMAVIQDVVHPGLRATYFSFNVIIQNILGSSLGPIAVGYLSDLYGIQTALAAVPLFSGIAAALFFAGSFHYGADTAKVEKAPLAGET
jgi:MFS family permease